MHVLWRLEDNVWESGLSSHHMGPEDGIQVYSVSSKLRYPLNHCPSLYFNFEIQFHVTQVGLKLTVAGNGFELLILLRSNTQIISLLPYPCLDLSFLKMSFLIFCCSNEKLTNIATDYLLSLSSSFPHLLLAELGDLLQPVGQ